MDDNIIFIRKKLIMGGVGTWQESNNSDNLDTSSASMNPVVRFVNSFVVTAGNATKLRVYIRDILSGGGNLKIGLYDGSYNKLAEGIVNVSTVGFAVVTISSVAVSAGTYGVAWTTETGDRLAYGYQDGTGTTYFEVGDAYTLPDPGGWGGSSSAVLPSVGIFIE